jgi:hypothetical protein
VKLRVSILFSALAAFVSLPVWADDDHDHKEEATDHKHEEKREHSEEKHEYSEEKDEHGHAHGEEAHEEEASPSVGPGKAIEEANETRGIRLSEKALKRLKLGRKLISGASSLLNVPKTALVLERGQSFVYVERDGWLTRVLVTISKSDSLSAHVKGDLKNGETVITEGSGLVRLAHLEAFGASGDGHGH